MTMVATPVQPDRCFYGDVEGDTLIVGKPGAKPRCEPWGW